jgi:hypothetical protein
LISVLRAVWEAADYPWSVRLKALQLEWRPWIRQRFRLTPELEEQLLRIRARNIDYRLQADKRRVRRHTCSPAGRRLFVVLRPVPRDASHSELSATL